MSNNFVLVLLIVLWVFSGGAKAQTPKADLIVTNAAARTFDGKLPRAEAIAVSGGRIIFVGKNSGTKRFTGPNTKIIDAQGRLVIPGFNDAHVHILGMGNMFSSVDLRSTGSAREMAEKLERHAGFLPAGRWIMGSGWDHEKWTPGAPPEKSLLDRVTPVNPVFLYNSDPNTALVNSAALTRAGIDETVRNPSGGEFVRGRDGKLTGILKGSAIYLVRRSAPATQARDRAAIAETASNYAAAYGVTSMQDMSADDNSAVFDELEKQGKLKTRVYDCIGLAEWIKNGSPKFAKQNDGRMVRRGCLKYFTEADAESIPGLTKKIVSADRKGWQVMIHAIGGAAGGAILGIFENAARENGKKDRRFRVEHAHNIRPEDINRFGSSKIVASMQPALFAGGVVNGSEPYRSLLETGAKIAFGSDSSMIPINPFDGIYAAVMRGNSGADKEQSQALTVEEAVRAYTSGSAYAEFQEMQKGTLETGKYADFIILSDDIFSVPVEKIPATRVLLTVVGGKIVYEEK